MPTKDARLTRILASVITGAWMISFILDAAIPAYDPPDGLHALMLAVAGWAFGKPVMAAARGGREDSE